MTQEKQNDVDKNIDYLQKQVKYAGFGSDDKLNKEISDKVKSSDKEFTIELKSNKATFSDADFKLNFKRAETTDRVFFNSFDAKLTNKSNGEEKTQNFSMHKENFTAKEAINLLEGRSVKTQINTSNGEKTAFIQLKLKEEKNEFGNFKKQPFFENFGMDTKKAVEKEKLVFDDDKHKDITIKSLEKGNVVAVKFENQKTKEVQEGKAVLNVPYKTINLYDNNMKRVNSVEQSFKKDNDESLDNGPKNQQNQSRKP